MPIYNDYSLVAPESDDVENLAALFRPLFLTSFAFEQFLADQAWFGASQLVISSASSKTGYGVACLARARGSAVSIVGLTSAANRAFTESLGLYDRVHTYDEVGDLDVVPTIYADVAGNPNLRRQLQDLLGSQLVHDAVLGVSHVNSPTDFSGSQSVVSGAAEPQVFGAFDHLRTEAMQREIAARYSSAWSDFMRLVGDSVAVVVGQGPEALRESWVRLQRGDADPKQGQILTFD